MTLAERFWDKVEKIPFHECWQWIGGGHRGYGVMRWINGESTYAHRISLLLAGYRIPDGMVVDHICRNKCCVNPLHLRIVTSRINNIENSISPAALNFKKTHCIHGHFLTGKSTKNKIQRYCKECKKLASEKFRSIRNGKRIAQP